MKRIPQRVISQETLHCEINAFGFTDEKGRQLGACIRITKIESRPKVEGDSYWSELPHEPGTLYGYNVQAARDGREFGACQNTSYEKSFDEAMKAARKKVAATRKRYEKKFKPEPQEHLSTAPLPDALVVIDSYSGGPSNGAVEARVFKVSEIKRVDSGLRVRAERNGETTEVTFAAGGGIIDNVFVYRAHYKWDEVFDAYDGLEEIKRNPQE